MDIRLKTGGVEEVAIPYSIKILDLEYGGNFTGTVTVYYSKKKLTNILKMDVVKTITSQDLKDLVSSNTYGKIFQNKEGYYRFKITQSGKGTFSAKTFNS